MCFGMAYQYAGRGAGFDPSVPERRGCEKRGMQNCLQAPLFLRKSKFSLRPGFRGSPVDYLVRTVITIGESPASVIRLRSASITGCPFFTLSPSLT